MTALSSGNTHRMTAMCLLSIGKFSAFSDGSIGSPSMSQNSTKDVVLEDLAQLSAGTHDPCHECAVRAMSRKVTGPVRSTASMAVALYEAEPEPQTSKPNLKPTQTRKPWAFTPHVQFST